ncbi:hypothetical protein V6N13_071440 [Hibiscus sabdariffa]
MQKKVDSCSPTCVLEDLFRTEEFETSFSSQAPTTTTDSTHGQCSKQTSRWRGGFAQLFGLRLKKPLPSFHPLGSFGLSFRENVTGSPDLLANNIKSPGKVFTLSELQIATKNFSTENLIGKGGYAEVYKGSLQNGQLFAVKRLTKGTADDIIRDFLSELGIMAHVNHPNAAKLIGYGIEGGVHLVLELSPNGSLASLLYGSKTKLKWDIRFKIAQGTAEGLSYLAPEYLMHGIVDEKTDVFSFGVLLLELVTGRRALDYSQQSLVLWAKSLLKKNDIQELIDPAIGEEYDSRQMNIVLLAASLCIHHSPIRRPRMNQVVQLLDGNFNSLKNMRKCRIPFLREAFYEEISNAEDSGKS